MEKLRRQAEEVLPTTAHVRIELTTMKHSADGRQDHLYYMQTAGLVVMVDWSWCKCRDCCICSIVR